MTVHVGATWRIRLNDPCLAAMLLAHHRFGRFCTVNDCAQHANKTHTDHHAMCDIRSNATRPKNVNSQQRDKAIVDNRFPPGAQLTVSKYFRSLSWSTIWYLGSVSCYACRVRSLLRNTDDMPRARMYKHDVTHKTGST